MISSASTLLLATLIFNAASVFGAPVRYPDADMVVRAEITEPVVPRARFASSREVPEVRDTVPPPVEKREASTEDSNLPRRFPRRVYHDFYQKRADSVEPPVARAPKPDSERRFPRRVYSDLYAERADTPPVARAEKPEMERRYPRRALFEKRHDTAAPAVPTAVANSTDTTAVIKNFIDSTTNQTLQPGTTIKETTVLMNKVTYVSDKNAPAPPSNQCNPAPAAGTSSSASGTPTAAATSVATSASATSAAATSASASATGTAVPTSSADPAATPSSATSSSGAQPTPAPGAADPNAPGAAGPSAPAPAADASATTTTAADPAATSGATNSRRSIKDVTNEPVAREPEAMPSGEKPAPQRQSGPLVPREPAPAIQRTSGPLEPREPLKRTSGPLEPREPAPTEQRTRGPLLPRRLGFSGAALASLARRSNDH
jgi:neural Wiskott-Aldrich syndrome protein